MDSAKPKTMRDAIIENVYERMHHNDRLIFLSADMGAPALDKLRSEFSDRFINVGIAEQNLINISTGLALEGFIVYAFAIAGFITMRAFEQIRTNLAMSCQKKEMNVNLIGVGTGVSYDMSGPSHHCLEDISIIRTLPNIVLCSPSDWVTAGKFVDFSIELKKPKYIRIDSKPVAKIYSENTTFEWNKGFCELIKGDKICIVSTGYMTHRALDIAQKLQSDNLNIGVVDVFTLQPIRKESLFNTIRNYKNIITLEEGFINKGGMDSLVTNILREKNADIKLKNIGFDDSYIFKCGNREKLYKAGDFSIEQISEVIKNLP
ncbi:MAG: hypothetical protein JXA96_16260 [Sedimentisphaerales bacterium]|nr:hypothetical protein [Sedimentisphaerales bacterium]